MERVLRDPTGAAVYVKELCRSLGRDPSTVQSAWLAEDGKRFVGADSLTRLGGLLEFLEGQVAPVASAPASTPASDFDWEALLVGAAR